MSTHTITRIIGFVLATAIVIAFFFFNTDTYHLSIQWMIGITAAVAIIAFLLSPYVSIVPYHWLREQIRKATAGDLLAATIGLIIGLFISVLLFIPLSNLPAIWGHVLPFVVALGLGYLGLYTAVSRKNDFAHLFQTVMTSRRNRERERDEEREKERSREPERETTTTVTGSLIQPVTQILLDTSAIIDGRIADISQTGFVSGALIVPRFVLNELQRIADSADTMRRNRGRRGLDMLNRLQKDAPVPVEITDNDVEGIVEVDSKLVKLARTLHCPIITNDFNLNRVAELQGVKVLNINELANAVKPVLLPGEDIHIKIMQDGKELGQGVGYLDDGTMIVVEGGRQYMNMTIEVTVTRVLQTVAGRMIFAHPKQVLGNTTPATPQTPTKQRQL